MMNLSEWFDFGQDPLNLYPFKARCVAAKFNPMELPFLLELGRLTIEFVIGMSIHPSSGDPGRKVILYFPERWLTPRQKQALMQSLVDVHETHPLHRGVHRHRGAHHHQRLHRRYGEGDH